MRIAKYTVIAICLLGLFACSAIPAAPNPPAPVVTTVKIPVPVKCVEALPEKPRLITDAELLQMTDGRFVTALHLDRLKREGYELKLEAMLEACK